MMLLDQDESLPASYPTVSGLSDDADALDADALWQRIEGYIAQRWGERSVVWIVEGPGMFLPPLRPYTVDTVEEWMGSEYETVTLDAAPLGLPLQCATYRITATVGSSDDPPAAVTEAFIRLAEYLADDADMGRVTNGVEVQLGSGLHYRGERPVAWLPKALFHSGAADLLRAYR